MTRAVVPFIVVLCAILAISADSRKEALNRPEGHWTLGASPSYPVELKIKDGRLIWEIRAIAGLTCCITLTADYSTTKDSLVYGVVTKVAFLEVSKTEQKDNLPQVDDTFSFHFRVDDDEMLVRDVKGKGFDQFKTMPIAGLYKRHPSSSVPVKDGPRK